MDKRELNDKHEWDNDIRECPICSKKFLVMDKSAYVYRVKDNKGKLFYYCSYSCFNKGKVQIRNTRKYKSKYFV